ncbi:putative fusion protein, heterodisulfide reductase (HdrA) / ferredoxin (Iron-sulfur-binding protein) [Desulfamplus magnetovallimortis]|uniref:Putative fusion protein, heterodisulfide reductase (HdrA) / ferredoxin (Iron-sulfur-binding protein) n=1 Tax=Desulfamplus magnetovallimortis TaxID=1246637 RepID=A0A1W1H525_9BACT|nr:FAD-dependent oxidoreductase [Desulfamplus magnetovallimortis]SLM27579.1 putative fusion protein, heterodisulfide reductase (HdrA) / ferredoxin (Iron-sulfur-binding protein) [Desulfamplus magnetovallimortis]
MNSKTPKVMVVGGGIAGLTAAWELSRQNIPVELVEKSCFLGGHSIGFTCKATDSCRQCGACSVEEMLKNVVEEPLINVHLRTEITSLEKGEGFKATLVKSDIGLEAGQVVRGFSQYNKPLYVVAGDAAQLPPETEVAETGNLDSLGTEGDIAVDAVIVATGYTPFDPNLKSTYGYGKWPNLITGLDLENIIRDRGALLRPSDGSKPSKVAFIQCVGSRDERLGNLWCSEVCCPYAMRMAGTIKHDNPDADISMFYIDIQNTGKEFPVFYEKIKEDIRFVRTIPVDIYPLENDRLELRHMVEDEGKPSSEEYDLVVLSVGIMPGKDTTAISGITGIPVNNDGFLDSPASDSGCFVAGTAGGPASIAATMADAGKTAFEAMKYLGVMK